MKELIEKYYAFTLTYAALVAALFMFRSNTDIVNIIVGAMVGILTAPVILPKENKI
jgi:hypothetical protein